MRRFAEGSLLAVAVLLAAALFVKVGLFGPRVPGETRSTGGVYHAGKGKTAPDPDTGCQAGDCHLPFPHARDATLAAFRNMHVGFARCLACHAKDAPSRWTSPPEGTKTRPGIVLDASGNDGPPGPHPPLGTPLGCRSCHSADGAKRLADRGIDSLPAGFEDPTPLRMIEKGGKRWDLDILR